MCAEILKNMRRNEDLDLSVEMIQVLKDPLESCSKHKSKHVNEQVG